MTEIPVETHEAQYLYKEGANYVFMENFTYEQYEVSESVLSDYLTYLKPNNTYQLLVHEEDVLGLRFPKKYGFLWPRRPKARVEIRLQEPGKW